MLATPILRAEGLKKHFPVTHGLLWSKVIGWVQAVDGIATFSGLKLSKAGKYTLKVTSPGLTPDLSNVFSVIVKRRSSGHRPETSAKHASRIPHHARARRG